MMVWLGLDGGGTKTEALVLSLEGARGFARGGPSNHQGVGLEQAVATIVEVATDALRDAGVESQAVRGAVLGLAGADFPEDVESLRDGLKSRLTFPFQVVNDAEIALAAGTEKGWGIAAVAGTGGNVFGRNAAGERRQVGGLGYEWGDYGSGIDVARAVLHHAFRSAELRGEKTLLEPMVLTMLGFPDYESLSRAIYFHQLPEAAFLVLAPLCFQAAQQGDAVAVRILEDNGRAIAESVIGCARLLAMDHLSVDVVLAGSLWLGMAPHMREAFDAVLATGLPRATARVTNLRPVAGAALMAISAELPPPESLRNALRQDMRFSGVE